LVRLQAHTVFRSFWFRALCALLVVNLVVCSSRRIPGQWRAAFGRGEGASPDWYTKRAIHASARCASPLHEATRALNRALGQQGFRVRLRGDENSMRIEAEQGWLGALGRIRWPLGKLTGLGRLGSNVVHLGVVLIIIGGFVSGRLSFRHGQWASAGDVIRVPEVSYRLSLGYQLGHLWYEVKSFFGQRAQPPERTDQERAALAPDWREQTAEEAPETAFRLRVDRFDVRFDAHGSPEYYGCHVSVLDTTPPVAHLIEVNRPLVYGRYYVYQQDQGDDYSRLGSVNLVVEKVRRSGAPRRHFDGGGEAEEALEVVSRFAVAAAEGEEVAVPELGLSVRVLRYLPHWQIPLRRLPNGRMAAGEAQNLSSNPCNPAMEVRVTLPGRDPISQWAVLPISPELKRRLQLEGIQVRARAGIPLDWEDWRVTATSFEPVRLTGLTFKTHPVMLPVWLGCGVMMLGICLCFYCPHERVWALVRSGEGGGSEVFLAGNTFKWPERFRERFDAVVVALAEQDEERSE
jgi:cytochrome c biogenesis protein ResB